MSKIKDIELALCELITGHDFDIQLSHNIMKKSAKKYVFTDQQRKIYGIYRHQCDVLSSKAWQSVGIKEFRVADKLDKDGKISIRSSIPLNWQHKRHPWLVEADYVYNIALEKYDKDYIISNWLDLLSEYQQHSKKDEDFI